MCTEMANVYMNFDDSSVLMVNSSKLSDQAPQKRTSQKPGSAFSVYPKMRVPQQACMCMTVLCCLLLIGYIIFGVFFYRMSREKDERYAALQQNLSSEEPDFRTTSNLESELKNNLTVAVSAFLELKKRHNDLEEKLRDMESQLCRCCPKGWTSFMNSCYFFSTAEDTMTWPESRINCSRMGSQLVIIETQLQQEFLTKRFANGYSWIGLTDQTVEGDWRWEDGSPLTQSFWFTHEPDDWKVQDIKGEDCAHLKPHTDPLNNWHDAPCTMKYPRICERKQFQ
nr:PREDICTED: C-type lectin domain family 4 member A-like isoform X2 [Lepisosteus oculatus]XP_015195918.1 PREDICTED: C-type lectin domain family 4 member A-like isoform X2 [Lepisosteus oculatus]XP_015195919.1 PREDICTED: C-type lectin domain family 4 member A-like isoform X2 [Lepisosteus oculatus]